MKKSIRICGFACIMTVLMFAAVPVAQAQHEGAFNICLYFVRGPILSDPGYDAWETQMVETLYTNKSLASYDLGYRLLPDYISEPADPTNQVVWCFPRITSRGDPTVMFSLNRVAFKEESSDVGNVLGNQYILANITNLCYGRHGYGVIYATNGASSDTILRTLQDGGTLVNEIDGPPFQTEYFTPYTTNEVQSWLNGFVNGVNGTTNGFFLTISCSVMGVDGTVRALAQKTLQTIGSPRPPVPTVTVHGTNVWIGLNMETNRSAIVYSSPTLDPARWQLEIAGMNAGEVLVRPMQTMRFYRADLE